MARYSLQVMLRISTVVASASPANAGTIKIANVRIFNLDLIVVTFPVTSDRPVQSRLNLITKPASRASMVDLDQRRRTQLSGGIEAFSDLGARAGDVGLAPLADDGESSSDTFATTGGAIRNVWYLALVGATFPSRIWKDMSGDYHQALSRPQLSLSCQHCCAARAIRQCRKPAPPPRFLTLRSKRRGRWQGRIGRGRWQTHLHLAGHRQSLKRHRLRQTQYWGRLPSLREPAAVATMVAKRASKPATPLGLDAAIREG